MLAREALNALSHNASVDAHRRINASGITHPNPPVARHSGTTRWLTAPEETGTHDLSRRTRRSSGRRRGALTTAVTTMLMHADIHAALHRRRSTPLR